MLIKVKTLTGKEIEIDIEQTDKVDRIKERIEEKEGIPPQQQRLIFSGKQMNDDKLIQEYKSKVVQSFIWYFHYVEVYTNPSNLPAYPLYLISMEKLKKCVCLCLFIS
ncbi:unnamed protein product [Heterobilharzia americana]|nr:unnamed protein product [Heterobilharzia americana]